MQGTLTTACLPDLLRTIYTQRRTGALVLTQSEVSKKVFFELGQIVFASSNRNEDRIGETLVRNGKLTREQLNAFLQALEAGKHLGNFLVEQGAITYRELISYVNLQIMDIIYSLFSWTIGAYEFAEGDENLAPEDLKLRFSTATVILEGVRRIEDYEVIRRGLGDLNSLVVPTEIPLLRLQSIVLRPVEHRILEIVKQPTDIIKILVSTNETPQRTLKALYGLLSIGLLRQGESAELSADTGRMVAPEALQQKAAAALPAEYTVRNTAQINIPAELMKDLANPESAKVAPATPVVTQSPAPLDVERVKRDLALIKDRIATQDAKVVFGLSPEPSEEEVRNSYYRLATRFHPDKFIEAPRHIREDIDYIFANLTKLYSRLQQEMPWANLTPVNLNASSASMVRPSIPNLAQPQSTKPQQQSFSASGYVPPTITGFQLGENPVSSKPQPSAYQIPDASTRGQSDYQTAPVSSYQVPQKSVPNKPQPSPYQIPDPSARGQASEYQVPQKSSPFQTPVQSSYPPPPSTAYQNSVQNPQTYQIAPPPTYLPNQTNVPQPNTAPSSLANFTPPSFAPPTNAPSRGITRAVSDELSYPSNQMQKFPQRSLGSRQKIDIEGAFNDLFDYLDDRKAPLFVADSLTSLFRTKAPIYVERNNLVEAIVSWARQKTSFTGRPIYEAFLQVIGAIRHAEQARMIQDFDPQQFYSSFIQDLAQYCPANEAQEFLSKVSNL